MKILNIVSSGYEQGGVETGLNITNKMMRAHGHEVITISSDSRPDMPHYNDYSFKQLDTFGVKKILRTTFNLNAYRLIKRVADEFRPDIVTLHTLNQPSAAAIFALRKYRQILYIHGPEGYTKSFMPWLLTTNDYRSKPYDLRDLTVVGKLHYAYFRYLIRPIYLIGIRRYVHHAISFSRYTQRLMKNEGIRSDYIPMGVNLFEFNPRKRLTYSIGYAGRLERHKGIDILIEAMPEIISKIPQAKLLIAGEGVYRRRLEDLIKKFNLENNVIFLGHLTVDEMERFYQRIDIFVMLSSPAETFGKVGVEALSAGRLVLAPDIGGISDWLKDGHTGYFIKKNKADVAQKVIRSFSDPKKMDKIAGAGRQMAEQFSMELFVENQEEYFTRLLKLKKQ